MTVSTPNGRLCRHFGACGGCLRQDVPYAEQLTLKQAHLASLFEPYWTGSIPIDPSPVLWNYRNKVDLSFGGKYYDTPPPKGFPRETVLGFKQKGRWFAPLEVHECLIAQEGIGPLIDAVRAWVAATGLPAFDSRRKTGLLKALLIRNGERTGERMVVLATRDETFDTSGFAEAVRGAWPGASIQHAVSNSAADGAFADSVTVLEGAPVIHEALEIPTETTARRLEFRLSPFSFFQTNTLGAEVLYGRLREWVTELRPTRLYDLYGGGGGIALSVADLAEEIISVECVASATDDGRCNAAANGVENVSFFTQPVEDYLRDEQTAGTPWKDAAVIVDPPRAGLHPKALKRLIELAPQHLLYVACKPEVLAKQELPLLNEHYALRTLSAVDLFPHTPHIEAIAVFERR